MYSCVEELGGGIDREQDTQAAGKKKAKASGGECCVTVDAPIWRVTPCILLTCFVAVMWPWTIQV